jgi:hypothetical protein
MFAAPDTQLQAPVAVSAEGATLEQASPMFLVRLAIGVGVQ